MQEPLLEQITSFLVKGFEIDFIRQMSSERCHQRDVIREMSSERSHQRDVIREHLAGYQWMPFDEDYLVKRVSTKDRITLTLCSHR